MEERGEGEAKERIRGKERRAYSAHDSIVIRQVRLAVLAAKDAVRVQVDVVRQPHLYKQDY